MTQHYDVPYMERTRNLYRAQGYTRDYRWARHDEVPFSPMKTPISEAKVAVITTAMPDSEVGRAQRQVYSCPSNPIPTSMYSDELSWHKTMTHTDDVASFLPLAQLEQCKQLKLVADVAKSFHCIPTEYSQRSTLEKDAPEILTRCQQEEIDVAILVPL